MIRKIYITVSILLISIIVQASRWGDFRTELDYLINKSDIIITGQIIKCSKSKKMTWNLSELEYHIYTILVNKKIKGQIEKKKIKIKVLFDKYNKNDTLLIFMTSQWSKEATGIIEINKKRGEILEEFIYKYEKIITTKDTVELKAKRYKWVTDLSNNFYVSDIGINILYSEKIEKKDINKLTKTFFSFREIQKQHIELLKYLLDNSNSELISYINKYSELNKFYKEYVSTEDYKTKELIINKFIVIYNKIQIE